MVFQRLRGYNITIKEEKFFASSVVHLGHKVRTDGIYQSATLKNVTELNHICACLTSIASS